MRLDLHRWGAVYGALSRISEYRMKLGGVESYFERLRIVNDALGPHWVFRLADAVGIEVIKANRPSWFRFYVEDADGLHCPLDPGAPETAAYLGRKYSDMDMAFYAGMGFDGYRLALQTSRLVSFDDKSIAFDGRYRLILPDEQRAQLDAFEKARHIPKEEYYSAYGDALSIIHERVAQAPSGNATEDDLERLVAGCLIVMCGGHNGCLQHPNREEEFHSQMESLIIFNHARNIVAGITSLTQSELPKLRAVGA